MSIDKRHAILAEILDNFQLDVLASPDTVASVRLALEEHAKLSVRKCTLSANVTFWLVILLIIYRDRSVPGVFALIVSAVRKSFLKISRKTVTDGALAHARKRLGPEPFKTFFASCAEQRSAPSFLGLRPCALDGVKMNMPDSDKNRSYFGKQITGHGTSAWPQMQAVCLLDIASRSIVGAAFGGVRASERALGRKLWAGMTEDDLLVEDRGFFKKADFWALNEQGRKFICRLPDHSKFEVLSENGPGDYTVEFSGRRPLTADEVEKQVGRRLLKTARFRVRLRLLVYSIGKSEYKLVSNVFANTVGVAEFAEVYHWRWDCELAYDELKTYLMKSPAKSRTTFRSKSPELVEQEFWAMLCAYNLVRGLMCEGAAEGKTGRKAIEMSFTESLQVIKDSLCQIQQSVIEELPRLRQRLLQDLSECVIDRPRRRRKCPRVVKGRFDKFKIKRSYHHEEILTVEIKEGHIEYAA